MQFDKLVNKSAHPNQSYRAIIHEKGSPVQPCDDCQRMRTEVAKLRVMLSRYGESPDPEEQHHPRVYSREAMGPPQLYKSPVQTPLPNARATEWESIWSGQPDSFSTKSTLTQYSLKPGHEVAKETQLLYKEINRLTRDLEIKQAELEQYRNKSRTAGSKRGSDVFEINGTNVDGTWLEKQSISQKYENLFLEEWKAAFAVLKNAGWSNIDSIILLQNILLECYQYSQTKTEEQLRNIVAGTNLFSGADAKQTTSSPNRTEAMKYRSNVAEPSVLSLKQNFPYAFLKSLSSLSDSLKKDKTFDAFIMQCVDVTWYMCLQNPPMALDNEVRKGSNFDSMKYQFYRIEGNKMDYVVWPILLSSFNGTVVFRGWADAIGIAKSPKASATSQARQKAVQSAPRTGASRQHDI